MNENIALSIFREFKLWKNILIKNFWRLFFIGLLGGAIGFIYAYSHKPEYVANTRFMLKNEGVGSLFGGQMSGLTSLLGGGQMGTPLERTAEVISSDRIVGRALLKPIYLNDTLDLIINHLIRIDKLTNKWNNDTAINNTVFDLSDNRLEKLTVSKRKIYKIVKKIMTPDKGNGIVRKSFDKKSGVLTLTCVHTDQEFAIALSKVIYNELNEFFVEQMTYAASNNADVMRQKLDSIQSELDKVRRIYATNSDQSLGLLLQQDKVDLKAMAVKEQMLNVMYAESIRNYESFRFIYQAAMPSLTLIEMPFAPLFPITKSKFLYFILTSISCTVFYLFFLRILYAVRVSLENLK